MDFKGGLKTSRISRPNCFTFDLQSSAASSGYASAEPSTEHEYAPFDWDHLNGKLENLKIESLFKVEKILGDDDHDSGLDEGIEVQEAENEEEEVQEDNQVTLYTAEPVQFVLTDSNFTVEINSGVGAFDDEQDTYDDFEAYVVGPSGYPYDVSRQTPIRYDSRIISRRWSQVNCTFRSWEVGQHTVHVRMKSPKSPNPPPLTINISRKYQDASTLRPIITADIEIPETGLDTYESRKPWGICSNTKTEQHKKSI